MCTYLGTAVYRGWRDRQSSRTDLVQRFWPRVFQNVDASADAVGRVDQPLLVDNRVVDLDGVSGIAGRSRRYKEPNLLDSRRSVRNWHIHQTVDPNPGIEETPDECALQLGGCGTRKIRMQIMGAEPPTPRAKIASVFRERRGPDDDRVRLLAKIHQPN